MLNFKTLQARLKERMILREKCNGEEDEKKIDKIVVI